MTINPFLTRLTLLSALVCTGKCQPIIQFSASAYSVAESAGSVSLTTQRSGDTNATVSVNYATADGTATNGIKYLAGAGTLAFGSGETNQTIVVPVLNDGLVQNGMNFHVLLSNPTAGATLGASTNVVVSITDNDVGLQFQFATNFVAEDAGQAMIVVVRGDDGILPMSVDFFTTDMAAKSGVDYTGVTNTLSFASQERIKLVPVPILNNILKQANRTFKVTLANPVAGPPGSQSTALVTIVDNDQGFRFDSGAYTVAEDAGVLLINVLRGTDDTNTAATVDISTTDLSAINGANYLGFTNTLAFASGEKVKRVSVPILKDEVRSVTKIFRLTLSNPSAGAALGTPRVPTVKILDNDFGVGFELGSYSVWENAGFLNVNVLRGSDISLGPLTVDYATSNLTAIAGQDYQAVSGTLVFSQDETVKMITVPIVRDESVTNDTSFTLRLSNLTGGATLGTASTTVNILNAPESGTFQAVALPFDTALKIQHDQGFNVVTWIGGGLLQRADNPKGPWQSLTNAISPYTVQSAVATTFYRVTRPRPVNVYVPSSYDGQSPIPLVILLHGYARSGVVDENYLKFQPLAEARGFIYCFPDSLTDSWSNQFWNATDAACDFARTGVDDAGYLRNLIEEIKTRFAVDRKRVFLIGYSNGGFMAYRMACESADLIAGIASLAGMTFLDPSDCVPSEPVNILHIHGTADQFVFYAGGPLGIDNGFPANLPPFPSVVQCMRTWATYNGATGPVTDPAPTLDLTTDVAGFETQVTRYTSTSPGGAVELWTMNGATHFPNHSSDFALRVIDWLLTHPKP